MEAVTDDVDDVVVDRMKAIDARMLGSRRVRIVIVSRYGGVWMNDITIPLGCPLLTKKEGGHKWTTKTRGIYFC